NQTGSFFFLLFSYLPQFVRNYK
ncbi:TPA: hypothetical protein U7I45_001342, partial [Streptococcus agalactiae]|nr:hypothetical protein [Streptococcus agalactiae]